MKRNHFLTLSSIVLFSTPLLLTGCDSLQNMFGDTSSSAHYDYTHPAPVASTDSAQQAAGAPGAAHVVRKKEVTATTLADPGDAAVVHPKTATTPSAVPLAAPSIGQ